MEGPPLPHTHAGFVTHTHTHTSKPEKSSISATLCAPLGATVAINEEAHRSPPIPGLECLPEHIDDPMWRDMARYGAIQRDI